MSSRNPLPYSNPVWFDQYGNLTGEIPAECVSDCTHAGPCDAEVDYWQNLLDFAVPRKLAIRYLRSFGGWTAEELAEWNDTRLAQTVLWLACGDIKEHGEWYGLQE